MRSRIRRQNGASQFSCLKSTSNFERRNVCSIWLNCLIMGKPYAALAKQQPICCLEVNELTLLCSSVKNKYIYPLRKCLNRSPHWSRDLLCSPYNTMYTDGAMINNEIPACVLKRQWYVARHCPDLTGSVGTQVLQVYIPAGKCMIPASDLDCFEQR